jgi:hypothetical protein
MPLDAAGAAATNTLDAPGLLLLDRFSFPIDHAYHLKPVHCVRLFLSSRKVIAAARKANSPGEGKTLRSRSRVTYHGLEPGRRLDFF